MSWKGDKLLFKKIPTCVNSAEFLLPSSWDYVGRTSYTQAQEFVYPVKPQSQTWVHGSSQISKPKILFLIFVELMLPNLSVFKGLLCCILQLMVCNLNSHIF